MSARDPLTQLIYLLRHDDQELASASAIVLGRIRPSTPRIFQALQRRLKEATPPETAYLLDALAATRNPKCLPILASFLDSVGPASEQSIGLLRTFGSAAFDQVKKAHIGRTEWLGGGWLKVAAGVGSSAAIRMIFDFMPSLDWRLARAASIFLRENNSSYSKAVKSLIVKRTQSYIRDEKEVTFGHVTCLKIATDLDIALEVADVWALVHSRNPIAVRRHALEYLSEQSPTKPVATELWPRLLTFILEVKSPKPLPGLAVSLLKRWQYLDPDAESLKKLLESGNPSAVTFALTQLLDQSVDEGQAAVRRLLRSKRSTLRHAALEAVASLKESDRALAELLLDASDDVRRREIASHLASLSYTVAKPVFQEIFQKYALIVREENRYDRGLLDCLAAINRSEFNAICFRRAEVWLREGRANQSVALLQPLVRWRHADREVRFLLAIANLRMAANWNMDDRSFARGLQIIGGLSRVPDYDIAGRIRRSRRLTVREMRILADALSRRGAAEVRAARKLVE